MPSASDGRIAPGNQPKPEDYGFDLERALSAVVGIRSEIPSDAFTAETLGTERAGNGVLISASGLVLTVGYLVTEAETIWLSLIDGRKVPGTVLGFDQATGFGLIQALTRLDLPALPIGSSQSVQVTDPVVVAGAGGRTRSIAARVVAKQEFAGYWEYVIDEAIFTAPAHPNWGGTAVIGPDGRLIGVGSLHLQDGHEQGPPGNLNMVIPIDLLKPILDDMQSFGQPKRPPRPWLGLYATEIKDRIVVVGLAKDGPAMRADLHTGDVLLSIGDYELNDLADLYRRVWSMGLPGVEIPFSVYRDGETVAARIKTGDRQMFLKAPRMH